MAEEIVSEELGTVIQPLLPLPKPRPQAQTPWGEAASWSGLEAPPPGAARPSGVGGHNRLVVGGVRLGHRARCRRGGATGTNPTDRRKSGT
ncbi:MAG: hypothetical protein KatS3mg107_1325 [Gemmataceae bacterium]|jgi:hypothetical protein|nr:MAG: hypothetical protein KatS3mg107_1325 [Gemmataceae bacterium]